MRITIELKTGPNHSDYVTKEDMQDNIDALQRAIDNCVSGGDVNLLIDTKSVLIGIQRELPYRQRKGITSW